MHPIKAGCSYASLLLLLILLSRPPTVNATDRIVQRELVESSTSSIPTHQLLPLASANNLQVEKQASCSCNETAAFVKGDGHLRLVTKIASVKVVSAIKRLAHQVDGEIHYMVELSQWKVEEGVRNSYPHLSEQEAFQDALSDLFYQIRSQLFALTQKELTKNVEAAIAEFFTRLIPPTFLCLSLNGRCISASRPYETCLREQVPQLLVYFNRDHPRLVNTLSESIHRYRVLVRVIEELHQEAIVMEKSLDRECTRQFALLTQCERCIAENETDDSQIPPCQPDCRRSLTRCFKGSAVWDRRIFLLRQLTEHFEDGFYQLEKGIFAALAQTVEGKAALVARAVIRKCGAVETTYRREPKPLEAKSKPSFPKQSALLLKAFSAYVGWWERLADKMCPDTQGEHCWNGTQIVKSTADSSKLQPPPPPDPSRIVSSDSLKAELVEASGFLDWDSDDEDLNGSGSGSNEGEADLFDNTPGHPRPVVPPHLADRIPNISFVDLQDGVPKVILPRPKPDSSSSNFELLSLAITLVLRIYHF